jgi:hypothetical protein
MHRKHPTYKLTFYKTYWNSNTLRKIRRFFWISFFINIKQ